MARRSSNKWLQSGNDRLLCHAPDTRALSLSKRFNQYTLDFTFLRDRVCVCVYQHQEMPFNLSILTPRKYMQKPCNNNIIHNHIFLKFICGSPVIPYSSQRIE